MNFLLTLYEFPLQCTSLLQMQIQLCIKIIKFKIVYLQSVQYSLLLLFSPKTKNDLTPSGCLLHSF